MKNQTKTQTKKRINRSRVIRASLYVLTALMFLFGSLLFVYPIVSGYVSDRNSEIYIENFENLKNSYAADERVKDGEEPNAAETGAGENTAEAEESKANELNENTASAVNDKSGDNRNNSERFKELYRAMKRYNEEIYKNGQSNLCDAWSYEQTAVDLSEYGIYDGAVGALRVPKMNDLNMPIFLGASYNNMASGAAQLGQTSMPIGGKNTNCVIAGHRGWNGSRYFVDIELMERGDMVYIDNLWGTLLYKVTDIKIIEPSDINSILIQKNKDMVTLITCHPYLENNYRYAVFAERTYDDAQSKNDASGDENNIKSNENASTRAAADENTAPENTVAENRSVSELRLGAERMSYVIVPIILIILAVSLFVINKRRKGRERRGDV